MTQYIKKQFEDGEEYIEVNPKGYPHWWKEFKGIVETSYSIDALNHNLIGFKPFPEIPKIVKGQIVFNPLVFEFLTNNSEFLGKFNEGYKKGLKHFKKNYFKKYPNDREAEAIVNRFNGDFKQAILEGIGVYTNNCVGMAGFKNGILTGYWHYESDQLKEFEIELYQPNPYPDIFQDKVTYDIFKKWIDINKDGKKPHKEISFIFQKLIKENKIRRTNHMVLSEWAYLNKYIDKETYDYLLIKGGLDSPHKILTKGRIELYNSIIAI